MEIKNACAVIPAHNEEDTIEFAIQDLIGQTYKLHKIIVVNDFSVDNTCDIVKKMMLHYGDTIVLLSTTTKDLRAGAINTGLRYIQENIQDCAFVLCADADSRFDKNLVSQGIKTLESGEDIGGVCSIAGILKPSFSKGDGILKNAEKWILWRFQKLEYAGFDSTRTATWDRVMILHGLCSMFRFNAIMGVNGYQPNHLLEDYKLTLQLKKAGWQTVFNPKMIAETEPVDTIRGLSRQRLRWMCGGFKIILEEGVNKYTFEDTLNHLLFIVLLIIVLAIIVLQSIHFGWYFSLNIAPLPITLAIMGYLFSLYNLRYVRKLDVIDVIIRALVFPELMLSIFYSGLQLWAYISTISKRKQSW